jgi:hypothetical protein
MATDAELAVEELFRRDQSKWGGGAKPPKVPLSPMKEAVASPETVAAEKAAFRAFVYNHPDWKAKKEAASAAVTAQKESGIAAQYPRTEVKQLFGGEEQMKLTAGKTRRNTTSGGDIVSELLTIRNQIKLYHWQTGSFARHKATDDLTAALDTNIDTFVEVYMGKYGRPKVTKSLKLHNFSESAAKTFVSKQTKFLSSVLPRKLKTTDTDLLNIRDEILADVNKVLYLFTLA